MLPTFFGAVAERALNQILKLSPTIGEQLNAVKHRVLVVHIRDWQQQIGLVYTGTQFHVFMGIEDKGDCWVSADFNTLTRLQDPSLLTQLIRQNELDLDGDIHLARAFSKAFSNMDIDWAEHFSNYLGDAPAQQLFDFMVNTKNQGQKHAGSLRQILTQLCQDELKVTIHPLELVQFTEHTRQLKQQVDSLEQRINALLSTKE
ncbi:SCP2 domain-containing protein [Pseudoalteromonas xiamenensis]|uniref:ubiquinone biosynthesis accessory factor UbiJ n=1 Tax=Pseudoalteromonas xiamenensis TaxID=882626 RepID=UPI0035E4D932